MPLNRLQQEKFRTILTTNENASFAVRFCRYVAYLLYIFTNSQTTMKAIKTTVDFNETTCTFSRNYYAIMNFVKAQVTDINKQL